MKKILALAVACLFTAAGWAQDNLALIEGTVASALLGEDTAKDAIDNNKGTRWSSNVPEEPEEVRNNVWFQLEWTEAQTFNTIKMLCEGAMSSQWGTHSYTIQTSDNGEDWTDRASVVDGATPADEYETVTFDETVTAKFVRLQSSKCQTWGYSFYEFEVYNLDLSVHTLTTFTAAPGFLLVGAETPFTFVARDQNNQPIEVELSAENATIDGNMITATAAGNVVVSATAGDVTLTYTLLALGDDNAPTAPNADDVTWPIFSNGNTANNANVEWVGEWNGGATIGEAFTIAEQEVMPVYNVACVFAGNNAEPFNGWMIDFDVTENGAKSVSLDIFTAQDATGKVKFETAGVEDVTFSTTAGEWKTIKVDVTGAEKPVHVVSVFLDAVAGVNPDCLLANIYFSDKAVENEEPTGLNTVLAPANAHNYNLAGQRVNNANGIVVTEGKKIIR